MVLQKLNAQSSLFVLYSYELLICIIDHFTLLWACAEQSV